MSQVRLIKKYPNRRLYDTSISSYITLSDVCKLVTDNVKFRVVDARTEEDLTHSTLLQIITEQEEKGRPILSTEILEHIIRFYGHSVQDFARDYLEKSLSLFVDHQHQLQNQFQDIMSTTVNYPLHMKDSLMSAFNEMTQKNFTMWQQFQSQFQKDQDKK